MLSARQFASAVGADEKWVENAARTVGRSIQRTEADARWLGAVREIREALGVRLICAANLASRALDLEPSASPSTLEQNRTRTISVTFDATRYHARFSLALAAALLDVPRAPGPQPPPFPRGARTRLAVLVAAAASGVDVQRVRALAFQSPSQRVARLGEGVTAMLRDLANAEVSHVVVGDVAAVARGASRSNPLLEVCCSRRQPTAERLTGLLADWRAMPHGVDRRYPFLVDVDIVTEAPVLALDTRFGSIVLRRVADEELRFALEHADVLDLGGVETPVLRVSELVNALREGRRSMAATAIPELEAAAVVLNRID